MTRNGIARIAGIGLLAYIAVGVTQMVVGRGMSGADGTAAHLALVGSHALALRVNILLSLLTCAIALTLAVALYGLTRDVSRDLALLALVLRVGESMLAAISPVVSLGLLHLATADDPGGAGGSVDALASLLFAVRGWNVDIAAILFAWGSTLYSWLLLRGRSIPIPLAWLGVAASAILAVALPLELVEALDPSITPFLWLPMAAFEIPLGVWLLVRGVRQPRRDDGDSQSR